MTLKEVNKRTIIHKGDIFFVSAKELRTWYMSFNRINDEVYGFTMTPTSSAMFQEISMSYKEIDLNNILLLVENLGNGYFREIMSEREFPVVFSPYKAQAAIEGIKDHEIICNFYPINSKLSRYDWAKDWEKFYHRCEKAKQSISDEFVFISDGTFYPVTEDNLNKYNQYKDARKVLFNKISKCNYARKMRVDKIDEFVDNMSMAIDELFPCTERVLELAYVENKVRDCEKK